MHYNHSFNRAAKDAKLCRPWTAVNHVEHVVFVRVADLRLHCYKHTLSGRQKGKDSYTP